MAKDFGSNHRFPARRLSVSNSFRVICIEYMYLLHALSNKRMANATTWWKPLDVSYIPASINLCQGGGGCRGSVSFEKKFKMSENVCFAKDNQGDTTICIVT